MSNAEQRFWANVLTEDDILEIRASPRSTYDLGEKYGVDPSLIGRIKNLKAWKHVRAGI